MATPVIQAAFGQKSINKAGSAVDLTPLTHSSEWVEIPGTRTPPLRLQQPVWIRASATVALIDHPGILSLRTRYEGPSGEHVWRSEALSLEPVDGSVVFDSMGFAAEVPDASGAMVRQVPDGDVRVWQQTTHVPIPDGQEVQLGPFWLECCWLQTGGAPADPESTVARIRVPRLVVSLDHGG